MELLVNILPSGYIITMFNDRSKTVIKSLTGDPATLIVVKALKGKRYEGHFIKDIQYFMLDECLTGYNKVQLTSNIENLIEGFAGVPPQTNVAIDNFIIAVKALPTNEFNKLPNALINALSDLYSHQAAEIKDSKTDGTF